MTHHPRSRRAARARAARARRVRTLPLVVIPTVVALVVGTWGIGAAAAASNVSGPAEAVEAAAPSTAPGADAARTPQAPDQPSPPAAAPSTPSDPAAHPAPRDPEPTAPPVQADEQPSVDPMDPGVPPAEPEPAPTPSPEAVDSPAPGPSSSEPSLAPSGRAPPAIARAAADISILAAGQAEAPRIAWTEGFEQGLGNSASALTAYAGRYTASTGWANPAVCTGQLVNYLSPFPNASFCPTQTILVVGRSTVAARETRRMADVLGQVGAGVAGSASQTAPANGSTSATQTNHALTDFPYGTVAGGTTVAQSAALGVTAPGSRYYALRMNAASAQCGTNNASLALNLVAGGSTVLTGYSAPVVPCAATGNVFFTSPTQAGLPAVQGILDPALSGPVRAAVYPGSNAALLTPAQIQAAQVQLSNSVTGAGSAFAVDDIRVLEVSPALDAAFTGATPTATVPTTLTYTITNTSELLAKTDWGFQTTLPTGLVVAPTPAVAGTCTNTAGAAFAVTATAGASAIGVTGGDLAANVTSCTVTVDVLAATAGTYSSGAVTTTGLIASGAATVSVQAATTLTVRKDLPARTAATDQFTLSVRSGTTVLASATTTGTATGIQAAQISRLVVTPGQTYTIHEAQGAGPGLGYANAYECTRGGTVIASGAAAAGNLTIPAEIGAEVTCTFTNQVQAPRLFCDTSHFYSVTLAGALQQGDIVSGAQTAVGSWTGSTAANALGVGAGGTVAYAIDRTADATGVVSILKWTPDGGFQTLPTTAYTPVIGTTPSTGSLVAGAVDPRGGRFLFGTFANSQFSIWSFTEANPAASRFAYVGSFPTGSAPNGNGDMAFDARGNLYVVGAGTSGTQSTAAIYTVTAETLAAAAGGTLAVNTSLSRALTGTDAAFANVNGIAFSPRGTVYLSNAGSAYEFDATTWARVPGTPRVPVDSVDLAGCSSPSTVTVQKNVVGRLAAADQFQLTAGVGNLSVPFATATTAGSATGRQDAQIGPFPTPLGTTVAISEAMATGSTSPITAYTSIYECWSDGVRLSTGTSPTGAVTMPNRLSASVNCTIFNSPRPASTVRITKTIQEFSGLTRPGTDWTVGTTAVATTGTATALPSEAPRQQTDANGQASWVVLFGSDASRATVTVSEVQQAGFAFVSGSCTVGGSPRAATFSQAGSVVSASLTGIASASAVECTIVNRPTSSLTLVKSIGSGSAMPTDWVLTATAQSGALPGPSGRSGTAAVSGVPVTPGATYRLAESGGPLTYVQTGSWQCRTATGATVAVTDAGDVVPVAGAAITCTVTNATATITLVKQVQNPRPGFQVGDWRLTATPAAIAGGTLPTESRFGAEYNAQGNPASTFEVRPGHGYTLSEAATDPARRLAYQELRLERLVGGTWTTVPSRTITAPAAGQTAVYRFVNAPVTPTRLPLTGGASADAFFIGGSAALASALALALWHTRRRLRGAAR